MVLIMIVGVVIPVLSTDSQAGTDGKWYYRIDTSGRTMYSEDGSNYQATDSLGRDLWSFDENGFGPFGSFYAAFDYNEGNKFLAILDPDDLTRSIDGSLEISSAGLYKTSDGNSHLVNVMWCLPTIYWSLSGTSLVISNNESSGTAYAHQQIIDGDKKTYSYLAIGVYESYMTGAKQEGQTTQSVGFLSVQGATPQAKVMCSNFDLNTAKQVIQNDQMDGEVLVCNFYQWQLYRYCAMAAMGSFMSKDAAGSGHTYGTTMNTGSTKGQGPYYGVVESDGSKMTTSAKVFIESAWGNLDEIMGQMIYDGTNKQICVNLDPTVRITSLISDSKTEKISYTLPSTGWATAISTDLQTWGMPTEVSSTKGSVYEAYIYNNATGQTVLTVGGSTGDSAQAKQYGLFYTGNYLMTGGSGEKTGMRLAFVFDVDSVGLSYYNGSLGAQETLFKGVPTVLQQPDLKAGKVFAGWYTGTSLETKAGDPGDPYAISEDTTLYAKWEDAPVDPETFQITVVGTGDNDKVRVHIDAPGGTGGLPKGDLTLQGTYYKIRGDGVRAYGQISATTRVVNSTAETGITDLDFDFTLSDDRYIYLVYATFTPEGGEAVRTAIVLAGDPAIPTEIPSS